MIIYDDDGVGHNVVPMKVIEDIKREIENYMKNEDFGSGWIEDIKEIIDKHTKGEKE